MRQSDTMSALLVFFPRIANSNGLTIACSGIQSLGHVLRNASGRSRASSSARPDRMGGRRSLLVPLLFRLCTSGHVSKVSERSGVMIAMLLV